MTDHTQFSITENDKNKQTKEPSLPQQTKVQKITTTIAKRKQRTIRLKWAPIFTKTLNPDTNPIFIYNYFRMMKSYDDNDYAQYYNYGFQDAGLGILELIELDKKNETIDISVTTYSQGLVNFRYLIKMYKSYQNQKYYELALELKKYQKWVDNMQTRMFQAIEDEPSNESFLELNETQFIQFQKMAKQWASVYYEDQMYDLILGYFDFQTKIPVLKMQIISKNLTLFCGNSFEETYEKISSQKNKDFFSFFVRENKFDGIFELEKTIKYLKQTIDFKKDFQIDEELTTEEGYVIPVKKLMKFIFYNQNSNEVQEEPWQCFIISHSYNVEPQWVKFLIEKRSQRIQEINKSNQNISLVKEIQSLDYNCQKEYFIEKFYNQQQNYSDQIQDLL